MSRLKFATVAIAALAVSSPAAATDFFDDWEDTVFAGSGYTILESYSGWNNTTGVPGSGIEIQYGNIAGLAYSGNNLIELDSNLNSIMTYGNALDAGSYSLSFWYSDRPGQAAGTNGIEVLLNAGSILSVLGGQGGAGTNWVQHTINFTASAGDTLSFSALGVSDSYGGYIDDVRLASVASNPTGAVPEPATWTMLILGFGAVGGLMRRPRRRLAFLAA